ncbi:Rdx family protein [Leishmania donovani]|uniref:Rdx family protein n=1 Tax=Leishmania donovani TaxID=5661 RepID=A0A504X9W0_LEIDO|nr:Rdx family protein [Leishmania donovani]
MSASLFAKRRPRRATVLLVVASLALLFVSAACCANSAREVQPTVEQNKDPYAYLDMLDEVDLQQMLYEKTHGQVPVSAFRDKKELVAAVRKLEEREDEEASFNARVMAAMQRKAALMQQNNGADAPSAKAGSRVSSPSPRHHRSAAEENNNIKDTGGGAGYAGAKKASPTRQLSAMHELEACSTAFLASLGVALAGQQLVFLPPTVLNFIAQQRGMLIGAGFLLNMVGGALGQTGAFEVSLDGELIFSKLQAGAVPTVAEIRRIVLQKTLLDKYGDSSAASS